MSGHEQFAEDLVLYAFGELDAQRTAEFCEHIEQCSACRGEYQQLQADTALLALSVTGPAPPSRSRDRLLSALEKEPRITRTVQSRPRWWSLAPMFASALLALVAILLWVENNELRERANSAKSELSNAQKEATRAQEILSSLTTPDAVHVTLVSTQSKPQPQGRVIYSQNKGRLLFFASNFAPLPEKKVYELWLMPANGKAPMPAGYFKPDAQGSGSVVLPSLPENVDAKTFAITIENDGGSPVPTSPIIMAGQ